MAVTRALLPFIPSDGAIVVTSSMQGKMALPYRSAYGASKHAVQVGFWFQHRPCLFAIVKYKDVLMNGTEIRKIRRKHFTKEAM